MAIKWSAVKVSEAIDDVEAQISLAEQFFAEAEAKASQARKIANLPKYLDHRINRLIFDIQRIDYVKASIQAVRNAIPDGAIEAEKKQTKHGSQQTII